MELNSKNGWITVNDGVMGGRSSGGPSIEDGVLVFSGVTNTRGGGFSSIRTESADLALGDSEGLILRVRGDGRTYKAGLHTGETWRGMSIAWRADFDTHGADHWEEIRLPFTAFGARARGIPLPDRVLDRSKIRSVGLMIYDGNDGPFRIELDWIKSYGPSSESSSAPSKS